MTKADRIEKELEEMRRQKSIQTQEITTDNKLQKAEDTSKIDSSSLPYVYDGYVVPPYVGDRYGNIAWFIIGAFIVIISITSELYIYKLLTSGPKYTPSPEYGSGLPDIGVPPIFNIFVVIIPIAGALGGLWLMNLAWNKIRK